MNSFYVLIGNYLLTAGFIIALVLGIAPSMLGDSVQILRSFLIIFGLIVGLINISAERSGEFLFITAALVIIAYAGSSYVGSWSETMIIGKYIKEILVNLLAFFIPSAMVAAIKELLILAKSENTD